MNFAVVATVMVAFFVAYLAFLFIQFGYVIIHRTSSQLRRSIPPADLPISTAAAGSVSPTTHIKNFLRRAWKNRTAFLSHPKPAAEKESSSVSAVSKPPPPPSSPPPEAAAVSGPTDEEVEEMLTGKRAMGPPRFLFTIKEEEREGSAADTASFEGSGESVVINIDGGGDHSDSAHRMSSGEEEEVTSPVIGLVMEVNRPTASGSRSSRLYMSSSCSSEEKEDCGGGGVALPQVVLVP